MSLVGARREFGEGPLARIAALIYTLLVVEGLFLLTAGPGLVPLVLLDRDASNAPLAVACALPVGPALAAALYALRHRRRDLTELSPAATFWRGYRGSLLTVLRIWVPWLAAMALIAVNLTHLAAAGVPGWWAILLGLVALALTLWVADALVIAALFSFRAGDIARLAGYFVLRARAGTLGTLCLLVVALGVILVASEAVLLLLGAVFTLALLRIAGPMLAAVESDFT